MLLINAVYRIQWLLLRLVLLSILLLGLEQFGATESIQIASWTIAANYRDVVIVEWLVWLESCLIIVWLIVVCLIVVWHTLQLSQSYHYLVLGAPILSEVFVVGDHGVELFLLFGQSSASSLLNRWKHWGPQREPAVYPEWRLAMLWLVATDLKFTLRPLFGNDWLMEGASFLAGWLVTHKVLVGLILVVLFVFLVITRTLISNVQIYDLLTTLVFFWQVLQSPLDIFVSFLLFYFVQDCICKVDVFGVKLLLLLLLEQLAQVLEWRVALLNVFFESRQNVSLALG